MACVLCDALDEKYRVVLEDEHSFSIVNREPLIEGHLMVLPKRHVERLGDLTPDESMSISKMLGRLSDVLEHAFPEPNMIALNMGKNTSQDHLHFHIMPSEISGGFRGVYTAAMKRPFRVEADKKKLADTADFIRKHIGKIS